MEKKIINGIQQIGIGTRDAKTSFTWYRKHLGFDIKVFDDEATANLMTRYTGGKAHTRQAILAMNMTGGGGLEIWQFTSRQSLPSAFKTQLGDLGINGMKVRSSDVARAHKELKTELKDWLTPISTRKDGLAHFFFVDPWGNLIEIVEDNYRFCNERSACGGVMGATIGVSDMDKSIAFYSGILGYDQLVYDEKGNHADLAELKGESNAFRRVLLRHSERPSGGFSKLLGPTEIELLQATDRIPKNIYADRFWGDLGYIHLCFDVVGMDLLRDECAAANNAFTVDSSDSFDMGDAAGHFSYIEDPDGTLIEFVETHKVPIMKKLGIFIDLKKRDPRTPLPNWVVKAMRIHRTKG
jgi:catechol 2,3-dioxygenase-like lactoylglutathione lyase family enzyme